MQDILQRIWFDYFWFASVKKIKNKIRKLIKSNMLSELRLGIRFDCYKETGEFNVESLKKT